MTSPNLVRRSALAALLIATFAALNGSPAQADAPKPFLSPLFTDNMVLQRGMSDPVWGWTIPGQGVGVRLNGKTVIAVAGPDGKWVARIGPFKAGGPYTLTIDGPIFVNSDGSPAASGATPLRGTTMTLKNVMVGDVWLCSGQSNMEFGVGNLINPDQTIAAANDPNIRLFTVNKTIATSPQDSTSGQWQACTPETIKSQGTWSGFSAVAYFFGKNLEQKVHVPIGLLLSSWGGTPAEAWTSELALRQNVPDFAPQIDQINAARTSTGSLDQRLTDWYTKNDPGTPANWQDPALDDSAWKTIPTPGLFQDAGIPELATINGVIWFRRSFDLPASDTGKAAVLHLMADDNETTWVNGTEVGATAGYNVQRSYPVPAAFLKPTGNVVAVRVLDTGGKGGIWGDPSGLSLEVPGGDNVALAGPWHYHIGVSLTEATPVPVSLDSNPNLPTVLYDGMISPIATFGIKGAIWYQGESNAGNAAQYRKLLPAMIGDWRQHWGEGNFPFLIVQLAGYQPGGDAWPDLRQAQWLTAQNVPNTGIATAIDIGDATDIHPKNKQEVGRRLALVAEAKAYGEKVSYSGPVYRSMSISGTAIKLTFSNVDGGLTTPGSPALTGFEVAGADGKFVPAEAKIDGSTVVVSSAQVPQPTSVRYDWTGFPASSLYNKANLPAFPFDTSGK